MAYTASARVPRIEVKDIVPHSFPGLQGDAAIPPAVKSYQNKLDVLAVLNLVSGDVAHQTTSSRYNRAMKSLRESYTRVVCVVGPPASDCGGWRETDVDAKCAELTQKEASELMKSYRLVTEMPPSACSFVSWANEKSSTKMIATKSFVMSFMMEFIHTPDAFRLKADLKNQYMLNDAAPAHHVEQLAIRSVCQAGTASQAVALEGTGVAPDTTPSAPLLTAAAMSVAHTPPPQVVEVGGDESSAVVSNTQMALFAMMPDCEAKTTAIATAIANLNTQSNVILERRMQREDVEHAKKLSVYDEQVNTLREKRKQDQMAFVQRMDDIAATKKHQKIVQIDQDIERTNDPSKLQLLQWKRELMVSLAPSCNVVVVNTDSVSAPHKLNQLVLDTSGKTIETRFKPGVSLVDLEMEQRLTLSEYTSMAYPTAHLTASELSRLGKRVAKEKPGVAQLRKADSGSGYFANAYFARDLFTEPLQTIVDAEIEAILSDRERKAKSRATQNKLTSFVAIGRPV
jgi:hypothetical protein